MKNNNKLVFILMLNLVIFMQINASVENTEIEKIYSEGKNIQAILEAKLAIEFKNQADKILSEENFKHFDDPAKAKMQANYQVNLNIVLHSVMDNTLINRINKFLQESETAVAKLITGNLKEFVITSNSKKFGKKYENHLNTLISLPSFSYLENANALFLMILGGFTHSPTNIKMDRMICNDCKAEIYGIQETDLPQYYHKPNCKLFIYGRLKIDLSTDAKLTVQQRIKVFGPKLFTEHSDSNPIEPIIYENMTKYLSDDFSISHEDVIWLISAYAGLRTRFKLVSQFYNTLGQTPGWILFAKYLLLNI